MSFEVTGRNNIFALGELEQASRGRAEPHRSVFFENNIVYWRKGELLSKNSSWASSRWTSARSDPESTPAPRRGSRLRV